MPFAAGNMAKLGSDGYQGGMDMRNAMKAIAIVGISLSFIGLGFWAMGKLDSIIEDKEFEE